MNVNRALELLELKRPFNENELKKNYYKKCLQYHPDKNKDGTEMFKKIQESYELLRNKDFTDDNRKEDINLSYINMLNEYINSFSNKYGWSDEFIKNTLSKLINNAKDISLKVFEDLDNEKALEIYEYVSKYNQLFNIGNSILEKMKKIIDNKIRNNNVIILEPNINDLINDNIYVLEINDDTFYVPLWHNELYYKNGLVVSIIPKLENNMFIDDDNNLHISIKKDINELINEDNIEINIGDKVINLQVNTLHIKKYQSRVFLNEGLSTINENDIFKNKIRAHVLIHLHIE
jgi:curved DNA-binding protein CbpA